MVQTTKLSFALFDATKKKTRNHLAAVMELGAIRIIQQVQSTVAVRVMIP